MEARVTRRSRGTAFEFRPQYLLFIRCSAGLPVISPGDIGSYHTRMFFRQLFNFSFV